MRKLWERIWREFTEKEIQSSKRERLLHKRIPVCVCARVHTSQAGISCQYTVSEAVGKWAHALLVQTKEKYKDINLIWYKLQVHILYLSYRGVYVQNDKFIQGISAL